MRLSRSNVMATVSLTVIMSTAAWAQDLPCERIDDDEIMYGMMANTGISAEADWQYDEASQFSSHETVANAEGNATVMVEDPFIPQLAYATSQTVVTAACPFPRGTQAWVPQVDTTICHTEGVGAEYVCDYAVAATTVEALAATSWRVSPDPNNLWKVNGVLHGAMWIMSNCGAGEGVTVQGCLNVVCANSWVHAECPVDGGWSIIGFLQQGPNPPTVIQEYRPGLSLSEMYSVQENTQVGNVHDLIGNAWHFTWPSVFGPNQHLGHVWDMKASAWFNVN